MAKYTNEDLQNAENLVCLVCIFNICIYSIVERKIDDRVYVNT